MTMEERIERFVKGIRKRNRRETIITVLLIILFSIAFYDSTPGTPLFYAYTLITLGLVIVMAVLAFAGSPRVKDPQDPLTDFVLWRREFLRQATLMRFVPLWYILPLVPGISIFLYSVHSVAGVFIVLTAFGALTINYNYAASELVREANELEMVPEVEELDEEGEEPEADAGEA